MRKIHRPFAVGASGLLLTMAVAPGALAAGTVSRGLAKTAAATTGATYKGITSQGKTIKFTARARTVKGFIGWKAKCNPPAKVRDSTAFTLPYSRGKFRIKGAHYTAPINGSGGARYQGRYTVSIAGTVKRRNANGSFSGKLKVFSGSKLLYTCRTGPVTWTAHKQ